MSYIANQYNYATPLSSAAGLYSANSVVADEKYFTLSDNTLDGSYKVLSGDVGLWGSVISDADGNLPTPFVVTITEESLMHSFRLTGSSYAYPVAFTVKFYSGSSLLYTITETANSSPEYLYHLPSALNVTHYEISITKLSRAGVAARLYNVYNPSYIKRSESALVGLEEVGRMGALLNIRVADNVDVGFEDKISNFTNILGIASDRATISADDNGTLTNIHSVMKAPSRRIYGKVYISYTDPMQEIEVSVDASGEAYNSDVTQIINGTDFSDKPLFRLYDNDLTGNYRVISASDHVGWVSDVISDADGYFENTPHVNIHMTPVPMSYLSMYLDDKHECILEDFTVHFHSANGDVLSRDFVGNTSPVVEINMPSPVEVSEIAIEVSKVSKPFSPASILAIPVQSLFLYVGYQDRSELISIDMLEELSYNDEIEALGGVSANELTVVLDNTNKIFNANNLQSPIAAHLRRNRKIVPWLGTEIAPGEIEWYRLGTYWSYKWEVPPESLTASVVGFDTIGLLSTTPFKKHTIQINKSLGHLIEYVLMDAKEICSFIEWRIDEELYNIIIPYAWFDNSNHAAALRRISEAYPMHIYCDRQGRICAAPQRLHLDYFHDEWSNSTNVIDKVYNSLYTVLPNVVSVKVIRPVVLYDEELVKDALTFNISDMQTYSLNFSKPYIDDISITIDKAAGVEYSYTVYSWGIVFNFTGSGQVRSIICSGTCLDTSNVSIVSRTDENSVLVNGAVAREVAAHFIQDSTLATEIINRIFSLSEYDKYDVEVNYRGDIALSINDSIRLHDGIAPTDRYTIKRHQLMWDGGLTGTAFLNT